MQANTLLKYSSSKSHIRNCHMDLHVTILALKGHHALLLC